MKCNVRKCLRIMITTTGCVRKQRQQNCGRTFRAMVAMNLLKNRRFFSWIFHAHKLEAELL